MAVGEYVSVSTQRDTKRALLRKERQELKLHPDVELNELTAALEARGLSQQTAEKVAEELTAHDPVAAHAEVELGIDPEELTNPCAAAISSAVSFTIGALLPLIAIVLPPPWARIPVTVVVVVIALAITGWAGAWLGGAKPLRPTLRVTVGGALAMAVTFGIGHLVGATVG
jgi:vacuolar iron transporter family protein